MILGSPWKSLTSRIIPSVYLCGWWPVVCMATHRKKRWLVCYGTVNTEKKNSNKKKKTCPFRCYEVGQLWNKACQRSFALLCFLAISYRRTLNVSHHTICGYCIITGPIRVKWSNPETCGYNVKIISLNVVSWIHICFVDGMWQQIFIVFNHTFTL